MSIAISDNHARLTVFGYGWDEQKTSDNSDSYLDGEFLIDIANDLGYEFDIDNIDWPSLADLVDADDWRPLYIDDTNLVDNGDGTWTYTDANGDEWISSTDDLDGEWTNLTTSETGIPDGLFPSTIDEANLVDNGDGTWTYTDSEGTEWVSLTSDIYGDWENLVTGDIGFPDGLILSAEDIDGSMYMPEEAYLSYADMLAQLAYDADMINDYSFDYDTQSEGCPVRIIVETPPTTTEYNEGDTIDFSGIVVGAYASASTLTPFIFADGTNIVPYEELVFPVTIATTEEPPTPAPESYTPPESIYHAKGYTMTPGLSEGLEYGTYMMGGQIYTAQECLDNGWLVAVDDGIKSTDDVIMITMSDGGYKKVVEVIS